MTARRGSLRASPLLVGAVTVLVSLVAVFISYSANSGLPFVPTYKLHAELPNASKLVVGNDVRAGGFRIGQVAGIESARRQVAGRERAIAVVDLDLDKRVEELPVDTRVRVRSRSALGLKYVELVPGLSREKLVAGDTIPLRPGERAPEDLEDVLSMFQPRTRVDARLALQGFGDGLAGRGPAINRTIEELRPFLTSLGPVMRTLSAPRTDLRGLFPALNQALRQVAPVAAVQAAWFANMADTFGAIGRDPVALQDTIAETPPTLDAAIRSFQVQTPFLAHFTEVSRLLEPATVELRRALPPLNAALAAGVPAFRRTPELAAELEDLFRSAEDLGENPVTVLALKDLRNAAEITGPAVRFVAPYQTVCNYLNYFFTPLGTHLSEAVPGGTAQRILAKLLFGGQPNNLGTTESSRPVDTPEDPHEESVQALHKQPNSPAVDSNGRADCQAGQTGYVSRLVTDGRYPIETNPETFKGGGTHVVFDPDTPGRRGGTYKARQLGIGGVGDVP